MCHLLSFGKVLLNVFIPKLSVEDSVLTEKGTWPVLFSTKSVFSLSNKAFVGHEEKLLFKERFDKCKLPSCYKSWDGSNTEIYAVIHAIIIMKKTLRL